MASAKKGTKGNRQWHPHHGLDGKPLKTAADVERIKFTVGPDGEPVWIGGHNFGDVYLGKVHFKGEKQARYATDEKGDKKKKGARRKWHRVAIKRFAEPVDERLYADTIKQFREHRVNIPKMGMVKLPKGTKIGSEVLDFDEWVQVSQLFGSTNKQSMKDYRRPRRGREPGYSKIHQKSWGRFPTKAGREFAVRELVKAASAGRVPAGDILEPIKLKGGRVTGSIPFDLDLAVPEPYADVRAIELLDNIEIFAKRAYERESEEAALKKARKEYKRLLGIAIEAASPKMKRALENAHRRKILAIQNLGERNPDMKSIVLEEKEAGRMRDADKPPRKHKKKKKSE